MAVTRDSARMLGGPVRVATGHAQRAMQHGGASSYGNFGTKSAGRASTLGGFGKDPVYGLGDLVVTFEG